jgi:F-type H+-transporting ATPase subunit a
MRLLKAGIWLLALLAAFAPAAAWAAGGEHAGLPEAAPILLDLGFFKVTNSMVITWGVAILLIVAAQAATRNIQLVPSGLQNFFEWLVETLHDFLAGIIGEDLVKKTFWFFATIFIFILFTNWFSLIPGVGSIGWGVPDADGRLHHLTRPLLRGGNADLTMTSAMALTFFACWIWWALRAHGPIGFLKHLFVYSGDAAGMTRIILILVFLAVGLLEVISILFRPVSLSFRLFGNIFAGENLLEAMALMGGKWFGWLVPLPFYFLELIVGLVQALVFMLLTAIFTQLICSHGDEHHEAHGEKAHH